MPGLVAFAWGIVVLVCSAVRPFYFLPVFSSEDLPRFSDLAVLYISLKVIYDIERDETGGLGESLET